MRQICRLVVATNYRGEMKQSISSRAQGLPGLEWLEWKLQALALGWLQGQHQPQQDMTSTPYLKRD